MKDILSYKPLYEPFLFHSLKKIVNVLELEKKSDCRPQAQLLKNLWNWATNLCYHHPTIPGTSNLCQLDEKFRGTEFP